MTKAKYKVLIIEDEALLLQAISKKMELSGIETVSATSGKQALDYLESFIQMPDAIWLDYHLQDMDGLKIMTELKKKKEWSKIPVLVISNSASNDKVKSMLALGAKEYLVKAEYRLDELIEIIKKFIEKEKK